MAADDFKMEIETEEITCDKENLLDYMWLFNNIPWMNHDGKNAKVNFKTNIWEFPEFNYAEIVLLDNLSNVINMYEMSIKESESLIEMYKSQLTYQANINQDPHL